MQRDMTNALSMLPGNHMGTRCPIDSIAASPNRSGYLTSVGVGVFRRPDLDTHDLACPGVGTALKFDK
jgi:hypothetical protein